MDNDYLKKLKERGKESHVYTKFQLIGLEIATLLNDNRHKALYIRLCKDKNPETMLAIAKDVAERKTIANKGGYFMRVLQSKFPKPPAGKKTKPEERKIKTKPATKSKTGNKNGNQKTD